MLESFFNNTEDLTAYNFIKKRVQRRCFPVIIVKFSETTFFYRTPPVSAFVLHTVERCPFFHGCSIQARNQEFFRAGEVSENKGTSVNI